MISVGSSGCVAGPPRAGCTALADAAARLHRGRRLRLAVAGRAVAVARAPASSVGQVVVGAVDVPRAGGAARPMRSRPPPPSSSSSRYSRSEMSC